MPWPALFGFVGGLVAVTLKGVIDYILEQRRGWRAVRASARLVGMELFRVRTYANNIAARDDESAIGWWPSKGTFDRAHWHEGRPVLASALHFLDWQILVLAEG